MYLSFICCCLSLSDFKEVCSHTEFSQIVKLTVLVPVLSLGVTLCTMSFVKCNQRSSTIMMKIHVTHFTLYIIFTGSLLSPPIVLFWKNTKILLFFHLELYALPFLLDSSHAHTRTHTHTDSCFCYTVYRYSLTLRIWVDLQRLTFKASTRVWLQVVKWRGVYADTNTLNNNNKHFQET